MKGCPLEPVRWQLGKYKTLIIFCEIPANDHLVRSTRPIMNKTGLKRGLRCRWLSSGGSSTCSGDTPECDASIIRGNASCRCVYGSHIGTWPLRRCFVWPVSSLGSSAGIFCRNSERLFSSSGKYRHDCAPSLRLNGIFHRRHFRPALSGLGATSHNARSLYIIK